MCESSTWPSVNVVVFKRWGRGSTGGEINGKLTEFSPPTLVEIPHNQFAVTRRGEDLVGESFGEKV